MDDLGEEGLAVVVCVPEFHKLVLSFCRCSSMVEQLFRKEQVVGSSPSTGSIFDYTR